MFNQVKYLIYSLLITVLLSFFTHHKSLTSSDKNFIKKNSEPVTVVEMTNTMKFVPDTVSIQVGDTVRWENTSVVVHSVTGDPSLVAIDGSAKLPDQAETFNSGMMDPDETFEHVFTVPGTYQYFCIPHEGTKMYGWIIVE